MKIFFILLFAIQAFAYGENYQFKGKHYIASYYDCDSSALSDVKQLKDTIAKACEASGVHILQQASHEFEGDGFTHVILLSESHASIHTYPEHRSCFVDLFTCGDTSDEKIFDKILTQYLMPGKKKVEVIHRN